MTLCSKDYADSPSLKSVSNRVIASLSRFALTKTTPIIINYSLMLVLKIDQWAIFLQQQPIVVQII